MLLYNFFYFSILVSFWNHEKIKFDQASGSSLDRSMSLWQRHKEEGD